ncbi:S9 family peptidase [Rhodohalobacter sp. 8-1]|uniref:S9 family peptidase n=1 Tax=Rhodohalobacter sp. 8-1 TaxID=3131972 RepID=UPI0030EE4494
MMMNVSKAILRSILLVVLVLLETAAAQSGELTSDDYERAEKMLSWNLSDKIYRADVAPNWISDNMFWYRVETRRGTEYRVVNASSQTSNAAFNQERLASEIARISDSDINPWDLPIRSILLNPALEDLQFQFRGESWTCDLQSYDCTVEKAGQYDVPMSVDFPDGQWATYTKDHNMWVRNLETGEDIQLTSDGIEHYSYGRNNQGWSRSDRPILKWSPDSKKISTYRLDERDVKKMVLWETKVGHPDPDIWPYALPGDTIVPMLERVILDGETQEQVWLDVAPGHQRASNCCGLVRNGEWADNEWSADGETLAFVSTSRDYKDVTLYLADAESGDVTEVFSDRDDIFFESNLVSRGVPNWRVLHNSNEFIWFNRSDNWGHLYLYDLQSGMLKNRITEGDWNVVEIKHVDEASRTILFTAVGIEEDHNPYHEYLYRVRFDGSGLELLTPVDAHHTVSLSPNQSYVVDTYSDFETPQTTVLRDGNGRELMTVEQADVDELLATGWRKPVPFSAKARDGETDIYGIMMLPSDFDENKKYPIINAIYPGPQGGSVGSRHFSTSRRGQAQALAELGFVVVAIDAMGSSPIRSREFHTAYAGNMIDNGLPDQITAMQQLAERYSFIDIDKAGIYGHSGGGFATAAALTQYPDFFKVGVAGAGNHDNRNYTYYWGEKYQGLLEEENGSDNYASSAVQLHAENLQGKLMLSYGSMDMNVHPGMTLLFIDELIRHNKDFDLVVFPNRGHGYANEPYNIRRTWDYFVKHLADKKPPVEFEISH